MACLAGCTPSAARQTLTLFGAASLTDVLTELAAQFTAGTGHAVRTVVAGSGEVARQVLAGAPADVVVLADTEWMDRLAAAEAIQAASRIALLTNSLVVIAPSSRPSKPFAWHGRIAIGDPEGVPAGRYARELLKTLGVWEALEDEIVTAADVRAVRAFVARGDVDLGVVYRSDALGFDAVRVVMVPATNVQPRIVYPAALTARAIDGSTALMTFLRSAQARAAFERYGFGQVS